VEQEDGEAGKKVVVEEWRKCDLSCCPDWTKAPILPGRGQGSAKLDPWAQFHQRSMYSFCACRSRMRKKKQSSQQCHLPLLGPTSVKAACKTLVKLTPENDQSFIRFHAAQKKCFKLMPNACKE